VVRRDLLRLPYRGRGVRKTLASFLQAFGDAGLALRFVREFVAPGGGILPWDLALLTEKPR
jgi:hypothetical protein